MSKPISRSFWAFVICLSGISLSATAQIATTGPAALARQMPTIYGPYLANISRVRVLQNAAALGAPYRGGLSRPSGKASGGQTSANRGNSSSIIVDTTFQTQQPPFVPRQLAGRLGKNPQERRYIERLLTKALNFYIDTARQKSVPLNDVALALNYYVSTNYFVYSRGGGPTPAQMSATRDMIRANMARDETFHNMSDKQKQEAYETLVVLAGFVDMGYGTAKQSGDAKAAEQFRDMARQNLETVLQQPIEKIHFTDKGLALN